MRRCCMPTKPIITPVIMSKAPPNPNVTVTRGCSGSVSSDLEYQSSVVLMPSEVGSTVGAEEVDELVDGVMLVVNPDAEVVFDDDGAELSMLPVSRVPVDSGSTAVSTSSSSSFELLPDVGEGEFVALDSWLSVEGCVESDGGVCPSV